MSRRFINIFGIILTAVGLAIVLVWLVGSLYVGVVSEITTTQWVAIGLVVVGAVLALLPDPTYRSELRGMRRVNPLRLAYGAVVFLFGFLLFGAVVLFLFVPGAARVPLLYAAAAGMGVVALFVGGRYLFVEPDGSVYISPDRQFK